MAKQAKSSRISPVIRRSGNKGPRHPGEVIVRDHLERLGMSQRALARACGVRVSHLNKVLRGKSPVGSELALRLGKVLRTRPDFWLDLQRAWDFWHLMRSARGAAIARLEPIRSGDRARLGQPERSPVKNAAKPRRAGTKRRGGRAR
jgi:addiction module HigA family antidote